MSICSEHQKQLDFLNSKIASLESSRQEIERLNGLVDAKIKWCQDTKALYDHAKKELEAERQSTRELLEGIKKIVKHCGCSVAVEILAKLKARGGKTR